MRHEKSLEKVKPKDAPATVIKFAWANDYGSEKDAQAVGLSLLAINKRVGSLTKTDVLQEAKRKESPLHGFFEWDNTKAAEQYRLEQAGRLVTSIRVVVGGEELEPEIRRIFVGVESHKQGARYVTVGKARRDPVVIDKLLEKALDELEAWREKYKDLLGLTVLFEALDDAKDSIGELTGIEKKIDCLSCDKPFVSPDPKKIRRCDACKRIDNEED